MYFTITFLTSVLLVSAFDHFIVYNQCIDNATNYLDPYEHAVIELQRVQDAQKQFITSLGYHLFLRFSTDVRHGPERCTYFVPDVDEDTIKETILDLCGIIRYSEYADLQMAYSKFPPNFPRVSTLEQRKRLCVVMIKANIHMYDILKANIDILGTCDEQKIRDRFEWYYHSSWELCLNHTTN